MVVIVVIVDSSNSSNINSNSNSDSSINNIKISIFDVCVGVIVHIFMEKCRSSVRKN